LGSPRIHPETRIGYVHLKANIERSLRPYRDALDLEVTQRYEEDAVFLSAGGYHHHICPNAWAGLFRRAILYPERREMARTFGMLLDAEDPLNGASEVLYLCDPDDAGVKLCRDRPREAWTQDGEGKRVVVTQPFGARGLLAELDGAVRDG
jgi:catechol 2,3-dioxygenase